MKNEYYRLLGVVMFLSFLLPLGYQIGLSQTKPSIEVIMELPEPKPILKSISWIYDNQNVTYSPSVFPVTNEQNYSVQLRIEFFSEPDVLMDYVVFSISHENGTVIYPNESLMLSVSVTTYSNPKNTLGEYYLKIYGEPL